MGGRGSGLRVPPPPQDPVPPRKVRPKGSRDSATRDLVLADIEVTDLELPRGLVRRILLSELCQRLFKTSSCETFSQSQLARPSLLEAPEPERPMTTFERRLLRTVTRLRPK